jgi:hypothetical protein
VCDAGSPLRKLAMCDNYRRCRTAQPVSLPVFEVVTLPEGVAYVSTGMNLDSYWQAPVGVRTRGITDMSPAEAFETAYALAERTSCQWLHMLQDLCTSEPLLAPLGQELTSQGVGHADYRSDTEPWERFDLLPYGFLTAGDYPTHADDDTRWYVRLEIWTGSDSQANTNAAIEAAAGVRRGVQPRRVQQQRRDLRRGSGERARVRTAGRVVAQPAVRRRRRFRRRLGARHRRDVHRHRAPQARLPHLADRRVGERPGRHRRPRRDPGVLRRRDGRASASRGGQPLQPDRRQHGPGMAAGRRPGDRVPPQLRGRVVLYERHLVDQWIDGQESYEFYPHPQVQHFGSRCPIATTLPPAPGSSGRAANPCANRSTTPTTTPQPLRTHQAFTNGRNTRELSTETRSSDIIAAWSSTSAQTAQRCPTPGPATTREPSTPQRPTLDMGALPGSTSGRPGVARCGSALARGASWLGRPRPRHSRSGSPHGSSGGSGGRGADPREYRRLNRPRGPRPARAGRGRGRVVFRRPGQAHQMIDNLGGTERGQARPVVTLQQGPDLGCSRFALEQGEDGVGIEDDHVVLWRAAAASSARACWRARRVEGPLR